ncbi:hypothetical protein [Micromonospora wenchangensis]|uniref:hypothetical protein n=1 Tax=Micromonospora wenchangensis TaxID=1185415 RepID=UPI00381BC3F2
MKIILVRLGCVAAFAIIIVAAAVVTRQRANGVPYLAHGEVTCRSGHAPIGIWVSAPHGDAGWAEVTPGVRQNSVTFAKGIDHGGDYALYVGCGGTPSDWRTTATSAPRSAGWANLNCHDVRPTIGRPAGWLPISTDSGYGRCVAG